MAKEFKLVINGIEGAITNVNDLEAGIERLEDAWKSTDDAFQRAQIATELVKAKTKMEELEQSVEFLTSEKKLETVAKLGESLSGAFGLATVAAGAFGEAIGLTEEEAAEYQKTADQVTAGLMSYRAVMEGLTGENLKNLKSMLGLKTAMLGQAEASDATAAATGRATIASKLFGTTTRAALFAAGIGAFLVVLGLVVANWDKITAAVERNRDTIVNSLKFIAPPIYLVIKALDEIKSRFGGLPQFFAGAVNAISENFKGLGRVVREVFRFNFDGAVKEAKLLGENTRKGFNEGAKAKQKEFDAEANDAVRKAAIEQRDTRIKVLEAEGKDVYALKRKQLTEQLSLLKGDGAEQKKERKQLQDDLLVLDATHRKKVADETAKAADTAKKTREKVAADALKAHQKELAELLDGEQPKPVVATVDTTQARKDLNGLAGVEVKPIVLPKVAASSALKELETFGGRANRIIKDALEDEDSSGLLFNILFGEKGSEIEQQFNSILDATVNTTDLIFEQLQKKRLESLDNEAEEIDAALEAAQEKLDALNEAYADSESQTEELEQSLLTAKGAERELIIKQLEDERKKRAAIALEKKKEDERVKKAQADQLRVQEQITKEQEKQNKVRQIANALLMVQTAIEQTIMAVSSVTAIAKAGAGGKFGFDNIAYIIGATAAIAAAVVSVKNIKFEKGGLLKGRSHAEGGIPVGNTGIEVEGNEFIVNKKATSRNLALLEQINRDGDRITYSSITNKYETGGVLPDFGRIQQQVVVSAQPQAASDPAVAQLIQLVARQQQQLDTIANRPVSVGVDEIGRVQNQVDEIKKSALK